MNTQQIPNCINILLGTLPIRNLFGCYNFDLTPYGINAYCTSIEPYKIVIFWKTKFSEKRMAIQVDIPTYERKHPEKLEATSFGLFTVFEYTKIEACSTTEINWDYFKSKFVDACLELYRHCA